LKENLIDIDSQTYKYDCKQNREMSWDEAIKDNLMIALEINENLISPQYLKSLEAAQIDNYINLEELEIIGVVNTLNNNVVEKNEAIDLKLLDLNALLFYDMKEEAFIPLKKALIEGKVLGKWKNVESELERVCVKSSKIGQTQDNANLEEAVKDNRIDQLENVYKIDEKQLNIRMMDAIMLGMITLECETERVNVDPNAWLIVQRNSQDPEIKDLENDKKNKDVNVEILCKLQESNCMNEFLIINDVKESVAESIYLNHLELDPLKCGKKEDEKQSILIGCVKGEINMDKIGVLLENMKDPFVGEIVDELNETCNGKD